MRVVRCIGCLPSVNFATVSDISSLPLHITMALFMQPKLEGSKHKPKLRLQNGVQTESSCLKCGQM
jgi:hypothetical protein